MDQQTLTNPELAAELEHEILLNLDARWQRGWQPVELIRQVGRESSSTTVSLALAAIAADRARRDSSTIDPRWEAQLHALTLPPGGARPGWIARWAERERLATRAQIAAVEGLRVAFIMLFPIPVLIPPPGTRASGGPRIDLTIRTNDPMLNRVRSLLAKAESTTFEAEAEAFTAKAQELMARHAIDAATLAATQPRGEQPDTVRIAIDEPYINAKALLLTFVAEHSRCRAVIHKSYAMASIVGFADDITATEMLFTSLLVQAQVALRETAASAPPGAEARSRGFRSSFLTGYAHRVAERLAEINATVVADAEAEMGCSLVPVLAARASAIDERVDEVFPRLSTSSIRTRYNGAGWASGAMAANRARFSSGDLARPTAGLSRGGSVRT